MKIEKRIWFVLVIIICALVWGTGCSKDDAEKQWGANCYVYMDNLPEEYGELPAEVRENTKVWLSLENVAVGKTYKVELTEENGYEEKIDLLAADVNGDGKVNPLDKIILARHLADWQGYETLPYTK